MPEAPPFYTRTDLFPVRQQSTRAVDLPLTLDAAYQAMAHALIGRTPGGWKLGGTNAATQEAFATKTLYCGPLLTDQIVQPFQTSDAYQNLLSPVFEPEISVCLATIDPGSDQLFSVAKWSLEIPNSALTHDDGPDLIALIADHCAPGLLLLGGDAAPSIQQDLSLFIDGRKVETGSTAWLVSPLDQIVRDFLTLAQRYDLPIEPGQWVATGGLCPAQPFKPESDIALKTQDTTLLSWCGGKRRLI